MENWTWGLSLIVLTISMHGAGVILMALRITPSGAGVLTARCRHGVEHHRKVQGAFPAARTRRNNSDGTRLGQPNIVTASYLMRADLPTKIPIRL